MKTILVLTDFTIKADHAAHYALKLARKIKANLLLCNVYPEDTTHAVAKHALFTANNNAFEQDSLSDLSELAKRLTRQLDNACDNEFKPAIEICSKAGPLITAINYIVSSRQIIFAVIAAHDNSDFLTFLSGNHANEIIENVTCPVLVLPYQLPFTGFNKIAFTTDLDNNSADILHSLYHITEYFDSEVLITHVGLEKLGKVTEDYVLSRFTTQEKAATGHPKIQYKSVQNKSITAGLDWLAEHTDVDLIVLVHHKRNFFQKIFDASITKKLLDHLTKPILVYPGSNSAESLPVF